ncbi:MAG: secretin N-terminal domain-containing protein, partial [Hyphomonadaceae bacterium]
QTKEPFSAMYIGADIPLVVNQVLGEFLKIDYSIAPDVSGSVTMHVESIQSRLTAIQVLRTALVPMGIAVIDRGDFVTVARASSQGAASQAAAIIPGQPSPSGGGVVVLTPKFVPPSKLAALIAPFAPSASIVGTDDQRRFLLIRGDEGSITAASSAAAMFDVDWFAQVSVATYDLKNVTPGELIDELRPVLGPSFATIDFVPIPRLSKLLILARDPQILPVVRGWVERLDVSSASLSPGVLVYRAKNTNAETLATSLRNSQPSSADSVDRANGSAPTPSTPYPSAPYSAAPPNGPTGTPSQAEQTFSVASNLSQNAVIVRGNADQLAEARGLLEALDQPPPQVLIEAAIIEITLNDELQYGINWHGLEDRFNGTFTDAANGQVTSSFPGFALTYVNTDIEAALNVLSSITKVEVISRPSLLALNNETANLQVGDQVPIVTQTAISVTDPNAPIVNQTQYRDTGVILKVTPRVRAGGMVELEVAQEVSQVARTTSSGIDSPTIQQRKIDSKLLVPSGQSVALGGLISTTRTGSVSGIPLLMDIPLLGQLFRNDNRLTQRTELVVFVTPRILVDGKAAVDATDELRSTFRRLEQELAQK